MKNISLPPGDCRLVALWPPTAIATPQKVSGIEAVIPPEVLTEAAGHALLVDPLPTTTVGPHHRHTRLEERGQKGKRFRTLFQ